MGLAEDAASAASTPWIGARDLAILLLLYGAGLRVAEAIVKYAAANEVDLIVLASHRVKPSRVDRDWGTMSYKVGILAQCPVLLVK